MSSDPPSSIASASAAGAVALAASSAAAATPAEQPDQQQRHAVVRPQPKQTSKHRPITEPLHLKGTKKRLVIAMVGLPARGKTYMARKIGRYLNWIGYRCATFNIGHYRRQAVGPDIAPDFFDPDNAAGVSKREELAQKALHDMFEYFSGGGQAAVYDGTNSSVERRRMVSALIKQKERELDLQVQLVWVEMQCNPQMVNDNIAEAKRTSPDSQGRSAEAAERNLRERLRQYERQYQPLGSDPAEEEQSYMVNIDCGARVLNHRIEGYLMSKLAFFVLNVKTNHAPIYITRHGESMHNVKGLIGGDPNLSPNGVEYAKTLASFIGSEKEISKDELAELSVWTSTLKRTLETTEHLQPLGLPVTKWRALVEIQVGTCENMTYEEISAKYPEEFQARKRDKLNYRYPQGESYMDVIQRIEPCILELERMSTPVLLVVHRAVARCLYSYFLDIDQHEIPHLDMPLHTVLKLLPKAYGCSVFRFRLPVRSVEDHAPTSPQPSEQELAAAAAAAQATARVETVIMLPSERGAAPTIVSTPTQPEPKLEELMQSL